MHRASTTFAAIAADFGAGKPQVVAQYLDQCPAVVNFYGARGAVDSQMYGGTRGRKGISSRGGFCGRTLRVQRGYGGRSDQRGSRTFNKLAAGKGFLVLRLAHGTVLAETSGNSF